MNKTLWSRIITGAILGLSLLAIIFLGKNTLLVGCILISSIGILEILKLLNKKIYFYVLTTFLANILIQFVMFFKEYKLLFLIISIYIIVVLVQVTFFHLGNITDRFSEIFSLFYVGFILSILQIMDDKFLVLMAFMASWGADTFAYFTGIFFGKTKLAPLLSPKKTVEGAIGGLFGSLFICSIFYLIMTPTIPLSFCLIATFIGAIFSEIGDLCASYIKRNYNAKDYGNIFGDHGGVLDRFDSVIFAIPIIYALSCLL